MAFVSLPAHASLAGSLQSSCLLFQVYFLLDDLHLFSIGLLRFVVFLFLPLDLFDKVPVFVQEEDDSVLSVLLYLLVHLEVPIESKAKVTG